MTDQERINEIVAKRGTGPDILFLLQQINVRSTVLDNLMTEYAKMTIAA